MHFTISAVGAPRAYAELVVSTAGERLYALRLGEVSPRRVLGQGVTFLFSGNEDAAQVRDALRVAANELDALILGAPGWVTVEGGRSAADAQRDYDACDDCSKEPGAVTPCARHAGSFFDPPEPFVPPGPVLTDAYPYEPADDATAGVR